MNQEAATLGKFGVDADHPWLGLRSFTEELEGYFYGRSQEAEELYRRVVRKRLTVLFGQSGLGKTSLLRAGLFPKLRSANYLPVSVRIDYAPSAPSGPQQIFQALQSAAQQAGIQLSVPESADTLTMWELFHHVSFGLQSTAGKTIRPAVVLDQFEEGFAIGQATLDSRQLHQDLIEQLADLIEGRLPEAVEQHFEASGDLTENYEFDRQDFRIMFCLREDYLAQLEVLGSRMPSIAENRMRIARMNGQQAIEAIRQPGGRLVSDSVSEQIVRFVAAGDSQLSDVRSDQVIQQQPLSELQVEPALLSLFCQQLNNRRIGQGLQQITSDLLAGSREHILNDFYEECLSDLPLGLRCFVEDELLTDSGYRESVGIERAQRVLSQQGVATSAIDQLVKRRLLHIELRGQVRRIELTHDVLSSVVQKSRAARRATEAERAAREREERMQHKFRENMRKILIAGVAMVAVLIVVGALGIFSLFQWQHAEEQKKLAEKATAQAIAKANEAEEARAEAVRQAEEAKQQRDRADVEQQRASQEAARAVEQAEEATRQRDRAAEIEKTAREFSIDSNRMVNDIAKENPGLREAFLKFYTTTVVSLEAILKANPDAVWAQQQLAYNLTFAAETAQRLGKVDEAMELARRSILAVQAIADDPDTPKVIILASGITASTYQRMKEYALAEQALGQARSAVTQVPTEYATDARRWDAYLYQLEAELHDAQQRREKSIEAYQRAIDLHESALQESADDIRLRGDLATFYVASADVHLELKKADEAIDFLLKAKELRVKLWKESDSISTRNSLPPVFEKLGLAYRRKKELTESRSAYQNAENARRGVIVMADAVLQDNFKYDLDTAQRNLSLTLQRRGEMEYDIGDEQIGYQKLEESAQIARDLRTRFPKEANLEALCVALVIWADILNERSEKTEAEKLYREALGVREIMLDKQPDSPDAKGEVAFILQKLATSLFDQDRYSEALELGSRRVELRRAVFASKDNSTSSERLVSALGSLSFYLLFDLETETKIPRQPDQAYQIAREALDIDPSQDWIRTNEALALLLMDRYDEAVEVYNRIANVPTGKKTLAHESRNDIMLLQRAGVDHPNLEKVDTLLAKLIEEAESKKPETENIDP